MMVLAGLYGNAFAIIRRDMRGYPERLVIVSPASVSVQVVHDEENPDGKLYYVVAIQPEQGRPGVESIPCEDMLHLKNTSMDALAGLDILLAHKDSLGTGIAAQQFGAAFFKNGASLSGYIKYPTTLNKEAFDRLRKGWNARHGGAENAGGTAILDSGAEFKPLSMAPKDAGLTETKQYTVEDISRITGVPLHMLQSLDRATFNNIEHLGLEFAKYTLLPWARRWEQECNRKLFPPRERKSAVRFTVKLDLDSFLKGDSKARSEYYRTLIHAGVLSINEARQREGLNPVTGGDEHFMQMNMTTVSRIAEGLPPPAAGPNNNDDGEEE